jgi:hypothetical protein
LLRQRAEKDAYMAYAPKSEAVKFWESHWQGGPVSRPKDDRAGRHFRRLWHSDSPAALRERAIGPTDSAAEHFARGWELARR